MCDEKAVLDAFDAFDVDKSGTIDAKELKSVIRAYFQSVKQTVDDKQIADTAAVSHQHK